MRFYLTGVSSYYIGALSDGIRSSRNGDTNMLFSIDIYFSTSSLENKKKLKREKYRS